MNVDAVLARIGVDRPPHPDLAALGVLQQAFLLAVPFENLDIHIGRHIDFDTTSVYRKIVTERRGGFCYECNGMFHDLLAALGYRVGFASARMTVKGRLGAPFDHMTLVVNLDRPYLVDVGNGQSCRLPLPLDEPGHVAVTEGIEYFVGPWDRERALFFRKPGADWAPRFLLDPTPRTRQEFRDRAEWHQRAADAPFTQAPLASLARPQGRITLAQLQLHETDAGEVRERAIAPADVPSVLREVFAIELPRPLAIPVAAPAAGA